MANAIAPDMVIRIGYILNRMTARGMTDTVNIYAEEAEVVGGQTVARPRTLILSFIGHVSIGGGTVGISQEGKRVLANDTLYFAPDQTGALTEDNYGSRWVVLPGRSPNFRKIEALEVVGPYAWAQLSEGGSADTPGNVK